MPLLCLDNGLVKESDDPFTEGHPLDASFSCCCEHVGARRRSELGGVAGLVPVLGLAQRCGLAELVAERLTLKAAGGVNAHYKVPALVAGTIGRSQQRAELPLGQSLWRGARRRHSRAVGLAQPEALPHRAERGDTQVDGCRGCLLVGELLASPVPRRGGAPDPVHQGRSDRPMPAGRLKPAQRAGRAQGVGRAGRGRERAKREPGCKLHEHDTGGASVRRWRGAPVVGLRSERRSSRPAPREPVKFSV